MPTASNVKAERFWPAVAERVWDSIRGAFTLPPVSELETHFQALGQPEAMRRAEGVHRRGNVLPRLPAQKQAFSRTGAAPF
jgi:hypothetical protein